jgi:hypothetical protein
MNTLIRNGTVVTARETGNASRRCAQAFPKPAPRG